jgi:hypothetical protein
MRAFTRFGSGFIGCWRNGFRTEFTTESLQTRQWYFGSLIAVVTHDGFDAHLKNSNDEELSRRGVRQVQCGIYQQSKNQIRPVVVHSSLSFGFSDVYFSFAKTLSAPRRFTVIWFFAASKVKTAAPSIWNLSSAIASSGTADVAPGG